MSFYDDSKQNNGSGLWLSMALFPMFFALLFMGSILRGWFGTDIEGSEPICEEFNERDADGWLQRLGLDDLDDRPTDPEAYRWSEDDVVPEEDEVASDENSFDGGEDKDSIVTNDEDDITDELDSESEIKALMNSMEEEKYYYYSTLSDEDKYLYAELYYIYSNLKGFTRVSSHDIDRISKVHFLVTGDHPELFYVKYFSWTYGGDDYLVAARYYYDKSEISSREILNENVVSEILAGMPIGLSDYEKVKYLYNYIVDKTSYNLGSANNQEYSSVFLNNESVCAGYARAIQYLLQRSGIQAMYVTDNHEPGLHAWVVLNLEGKYYHLDVTWADPTDESIPRPLYAYFCIPTSVVTRDSERAHEIDWEIYPIPECDSMDSNFYVVEGFYVDGVDDEQLNDICRRSMLECDGTVTIMASSEGVMKALYQYLIEDSKINEYTRWESSWHLIDWDTLTINMWEN